MFFVLPAWHSKAFLSSNETDKDPASSIRYRNKHGKIPQGVENTQTVDVMEGDARVQSALDLLLARVD